MIRLFVTSLLAFFLTTSAFAEALKVGLVLDNDNPSAQCCLASAISGK